MNDNNAISDDDASSMVSDNTSASDDVSDAASDASSDIEMGGAAPRNTKEHKRFQAYVITFNKNRLINSHFVRVKSTSVKGAAAKAITRAVQSPRQYKNSGEYTRTNRLKPYPADIKNAVKSGREVFVAIRGINKANKPLRPYVYVGSLVEQDTNLAIKNDDSPGKVNFKYKAKLYSLDLSRTQIVHDLNRLSALQGVRVNKNGQKIVRTVGGKKVHIPCKKLSPEEVRETFDEPRRHLAELAKIGNGILRDISFPDHSDPTESAHVSDGRIKVKACAKP